MNAAQPRLLIIEDDDAIRMQLKYALRIRINTAASMCRSACPFWLLVLAFRRRMHLLSRTFPSVNFAS